MHFNYQTEYLMKDFANKNMTRIALSGVIGAVTLLTGCATNTVQVSNPQTTNEAQLASLNQTANLVSNQLNKLIRLEGGKAEVVNSGKEALATPLTVKWSGSGEDLAKEVAKQIGFEFKVTGPIPLTPVIVPLDAKERTAESILHIVADRMNSVADVGVSANKKLIEIMYRPR